MKLLLAILLLVHGLIHLLGFLKAFGIGQYPMFSVQIGRVHGLIWLLSFFLLLLTALTMYFNHKLWPWLGLLAILISQILIVISWADAKYGTWVNLLLLLVIIPGIGEFFFNKKVDGEVKLLTNLQEVSIDKSVDSKLGKALPPIVADWLKNSGIGSSDSISKVYLTQKGEMRTRPDGKWMSFQAEQWFSIKDPGFIWKTRVQMLGPVFLSGRDKLIGGKGQMDISLLSLIPVVRADNDRGINEASMTRFLAEMIWFPSAANEPYISWESIGTHKARAVSTYGDQSVSGVFSFNDKAEPIAFEAMRYMETGENAKLEKWVIKNLSFRIVNGIRIPDKSEIIWDLKEGEYHWLTLEISEIQYD
ncbi:DUF6544 family protein [Muriicola sp. E247]|uniref:DUF6544 family protein n=1 Tax=Muriicola sp. E247 TaxID=3242730 RepID=UPI0035258C98